MKPKILVTAGPTWVRLDRFRIITNVSTGLTGMVIAREFARRGFKVKLLQGPTCLHRLKDKVDVEEFKYFEELKDKLIRELSHTHYQAIIHAAAVSDYRPFKVYTGKIKSQQNSFILKLRPTPKLISIIRRRAQDSLVAQFKLEANITLRQLIDIARHSLEENRADIVVANRQEDVKQDRYRGYIIDSSGEIVAVKTRQQLAEKLCKIVESLRR